MEAKVNNQEYVRVEDTPNKKRCGSCPRCDIFKDFGRCYPPPCQYTTLKGEVNLLRKPGVRVIGDYCEPNYIWKRKV